MCQILIALTNAYNHNIAIVEFSYRLYMWLIIQGVSLTFSAKGQLVFTGKHNYLN